MNEPVDDNGTPPVEPRAATLSDRVRSLRLPDRPTAEPGTRAWLPWHCACCSPAAPASSA